MARRRNGKVRDSIFGVTAVDSQLIYDVGAHRGEDTDFYPAKGFRVVAVEANPLLSGKLREKFRSQLDDGTLALVDAAIAETTGEVDFYIDQHMSD